MFKFETSKKDDSVFIHKMIMNDVLVDTIENYSETISIENYISEVGVKLNIDLLNQFDKEGLFKKYTNTKRVDGKYVCAVTYKNEDKITAVEFTSSKKVPDNILINVCSEGYDDILYVNKWIPAFVKSLAKGYILKKENSEENALVIDLPKEFADTYFKHSKDMTKTIIDFTKKLVNK